ncbi:MAG: hypothetical protein WD059_13270, partial [Balneolaceae bacterium]
SKLISEDESSPSDKNEQAENVSTENKIKLINKCIMTSSVDTVKNAITTDPAHNPKWTGGRGDYELINS